MSESPWYTSWFNQDYVDLYSYRDPNEAAKQVNFIIENLKLSRDKRILDLGCGEGRHSMAFAKYGYQVLGIDISETLIKRAHKFQVQSNFSNVQFLLADMFSLPNIGTFDLIINMFTSFGYYKDNDKNKEVFMTVADHLNDNGYFFLDYLNPSYVIDNLVPNETIEVNKSIVHITRTFEGDRVIKTIHFPHKTYIEKVKLYSNNQINSMLLSTNLSPIQIWGDYDGSEYSNLSHRQLILSKKM